MCLPFACILTQCDRLRLDHFTSDSISVLFPFQFCFLFSHLSSNDRWCGILKTTASLVLPLVQMSCVVCMMFTNCWMPILVHIKQPTSFRRRDFTSDFDVIGPYFTCENSLEMKFLAACLFEAMYVFEAYNFHILGLICDGASCNLAMLKCLCDRSGRYGSNINSEGGVPASFVNPYSGRMTFLSICPSHQVCM